MATLTTPAARTERPQRGRRGIETWSIGRLARVVTMLFVAVIFAFPVLGFIAMAFRSNEGVEAGSGGF